MTAMLTPESTEIEYSNFNAQLIIGLFLMSSVPCPVRREYNKIRKMDCIDESKAESISRTSCR